MPPFLPEFLRRVQRSYEAEPNPIKGKVANCAEDFAQIPRSRPLTDRRRPRRYPR